MLDIKKLYYLDAIYRTKSFTKASEELFVSQPAISAAITSLEDEIGVKLITRSSKGVFFTVAGEQFMLRAKKIISEAEAAENELKDYSTKMEKTINFGISTTLAYNLLAYLYKEFFPKWPDSNVSINEDVMFNHINKIKNGEIDLSYNAIPDDLNGLEAEVITKAEIYAIMRTDHELASKERIELEDLNDEHIAIPGEMSRIRELIMNGFQKKGVHPHIVSQHNQVFCMIQMVRYSDAIGFINEMDGYLNSSFDKEFALRRIGDGLKIDVGFIMKSKKTLPLLGRELIKAAKENSEKWLIS